MKQAGKLVDKSRSTVLKFSNKFIHTKDVLKKGNKNVIDIHFLLEHFMVKDKALYNDFMSQIDEDFEPYEDDSKNELNYEDDSNVLVDNDMVREYIDSLKEEIQSLKSQLLVKDTQLKGSTELASQIAKNEAELITRQKEANYLLGRELGKEIEGKVIKVKSKDK